MATQCERRATAPFESISRDGLPDRRKGKRHVIVGQLLESLEEPNDGRALKIPFSEVLDIKANIRSALSRASKQKKLNVATSSDETHFYMWAVTEP
jgi:hypothetical protein